MCYTACAVIENHVSFWNEVSRHFACLAEAYASMTRCVCESRLCCAMQSMANGISHSLPFRQGSAGWRFSRMRGEESIHPLGAGRESKAGRFAECERVGDSMRDRDCLRREGQKAASRSSVKLSAPSLVLAQVATRVRAVVGRPTTSATISSW